MQVGALSPGLVGASASAPEARPTKEADPGFAASLDAASGPRVVSAERTKLTTEQAREALKTAWKTHFGEEPREETLAILTAQWSHETGGGESMFNFNFGGIKGTGPSGLSVAQRTREGFGASERTIVDRFRAYGSAAEGATDYVGLLQRRYGSALEAAHQGDPAAFVQELKKGGYFTGSERDYVRSVTNRTEQLLGRAPSISSSSLPTAITPPPAARPTFDIEPPAALAMSAPRSGGANAPGRVHTELPSRLAPLSREPFVQLQAMDDALSRAALRIANSSFDRKEDA